MKFFGLSVCSFALLLFCTNLYAYNFYVAPWGDDSWAGDASHPFRTIIMGEAVALPGDSVSVLSGIYYESISVRNGGVEGLPVTFRVPPGEIVTVKAQVDYCFLIPDSIEYVVIEGFYLTQAYPTTSAHGSGIRCLGNHCDFICNHIYDNGGAGILVETFTEDPSYSNHHTYIFGNILSDNGESGLRIKRSDNATIISNLMIHNGYTIEPVGALTFYGADSTLVLNNTFWDNAGPAIQIYNGSNQEITPITTNSLVANNISADDDGSVLFRVESNMINEPSNEFSHNLWYNGVPGSPIVSWGFDNVGAGNGMNLSFDQYLAIVSALNPNSGVGSMEADPLFSNPPDQIFDLSPGSPAFDAGALDLTSLGLEGLTANSDQSLDTGIPDLGYHHLPNVWISNPVIYNAVSMKIYPNPMNDKVRFEIELPSTNYPALPTIRIFNDLGQCVSRIRARDDSQNNTYNLVWEPDAYLASGLYFVYMNAAGFKSKARLILLK